MTRFDTRLIQPDFCFLLAFSRLGERLRIAGTAELDDYDRDLNRVRCEAIVRRLEELFPGGSDVTQARFCAGLRPATPSNCPSSGARGCRTSSSPRATAPWAGRMPAAQASRSRAS